MGLMCGRSAVTTDPALLAAKIHAIDEATGAPGVRGPNYNVAPTSTVATVVSRHTEPGDQATRRVRLMRWGLMPPWAKTGVNGAPGTLINARAERATTAPAFRSSAKSQRCLIPMDGYYEWRVNDASPGNASPGNASPGNASPGNASPGKKSRKTPFFMYRDDGESLFVAGLWTARQAEGDTAPLLSCAIITTDAPGPLSEIHHRMPLVVPERDWDRWLDPDAPADERLLSSPPDVRGIRMREVSTLVNNVRNNGPELITPAEPQPEQARLL
jgi:putative SOS response-associated peptidase YedK